MLKFLGHVAKLDPIALAGRGAGDASCSSYYGRTDVHPDPPREGTWERRVGPKIQGGGAAYGWTESGGMSNDLERGRPIGLGDQTSSEFKGFLF